MCPSRASRPPRCRAWLVGAEASGAGRVAVASWHDALAAPRRSLEVSARSTGRTSRCTTSPATSRSWRSWGWRVSALSRRPCQSTARSCDARARARRGRDARARARRLHASPSGSRVGCCAGRLQRHPSAQRDGHCRGVPRLLGAISRAGICPVDDGPRGAAARREFNVDSKEAEARGEVSARMDAEASGEMLLRVLAAANSGVPGVSSGRLRLGRSIFLCDRTTAFSAGMCAGASC